MTKTQQKALELILELNESEFSHLSSKTLGSEWKYVGSNSKDDGEDAHWMRFHSGCITSLTTSTYGDGSQYYLVQETIVDLNALKDMAESVIPFGDSTESDQQDPGNEDGLAQIINNIAHSLPAHGGDYTETIYNPSLLEMSKELGLPVGERLINKLFSEIAQRYDIPFNG